MKGLQMESNFKSCYTRSFEKKSVVEYPLTHNRIKRETRKDLAIPIFQGKILSSYNTDFDYKNRADVNCFRRSSVLSKPNLKRFHEEYSGNSFKSQETTPTTTGAAHGPLKPINNLKIIQSEQPAKEFICSMQLRGKDHFLPISIHENSFCKLLDIYVSTSHLAHIDLFRKQKNSVAKDLDSYYDGIPKMQRTKSSQADSDNFNPQRPSLYRQFPKQLVRVPYSGNISTYSKDYKNGSLNFNQFNYNLDFPTVHKLTKSDILVVPGMYCTEKNHFGTGWPIRAVINI